MMALTEIARLTAELIEAMEHGDPLDTFKLGTIKRIAEEQIALAEIERGPE